MYVSDSIWKNWLAPAGVTLAVIWGVYLGATSAFVWNDANGSEGAHRSTKRNILLGQGDPHSPSSASNAQSQPAAMLSADGEVSPTKTGVSDRVKRYRAARIALALASASKQIDERSKLSRRSSDRLNNVSQKRLRDEIMSEAFKIALHGEDPWQNLIIISSEYHRQGDRATARKVMLAAAKLAIDPDDTQESSAAVKKVVKAMLVQKQYKDAMAALQNITYVDEREKAMAEIAAWAARGGQLSLAQNIVGQISKASSRDVALVAIAESQASYEGGNVAFRTAESVSHVNKKDDTYRRIALRRARVNDFAEAHEAIEQIKNTKLRDSALSMVARQYARSGDINGGIEILNRVSDPSVADASLRFLSKDLAKSGWFSSSAYVATRIVSDDEKSYALESLSQELAKSGDVTLSLVHSGDIPLSRVRERTLRYISAVTADKGAPGRARNVALRIGSDSERDLAYRDIAKASAQNGDHVAAFNTLQEIAYPRDKALAMVSLARALNKDGSKNKALALLEGARRETRELNSRNLDLVRGNMAVAYAERSESEHSLHLVDKINDTKLRDKAYQSLARTMATKRDVESAQRSVLSISSDQLRHSTEDAVARTLARSVSPQKAVRSSRSLLTGRQRVVFLLEISKRT